MKSFDEKSSIPAATAAVKQPGRLMRRELIAIAAVIAAVLACGSLYLFPRAAGLARRVRAASLPLWTETTYNMSYGPWPENRLDIMRRRWARADASPAVLVFHGGGWRTGYRDEMRERVCRRYVARGFVAVNVEYRSGLPEAAEDAEAALGWFIERSAQYAVDARRIVVTGESAGGHLALWAALGSRERVAAVVNFYGVSDLESLLEMPSVRRALPEPNREEAARRLSPLALVSRHVCPVFSVHGTDDPKVPMDQATRLTRRIRESGGVAEEFLVAGGGHGFSDTQLDTVYNAVFAFLRRHGVLG